MVFIAVVKFATKNILRAIEKIILKKQRKVRKKAVSKKTEYYANYKNNWYTENKVELNKRGKEYYEQNKESILEQSREYRIEKRKRQLEQYSKIESKNCKKCLLLKSRENFTTSKVGKFGLSDICIPCRNRSLIEKREKSKIRSKEYYKSNKKNSFRKRLCGKSKKVK